jgi:hypothetical protein
MWPIRDPIAKPFESRATANIDQLVRVGRLHQSIMTPG